MNISNRNKILGKPLLKERSQQMLTVQKSFPVAMNMTGFAVINSALSFAREFHTETHSIWWPLTKYQTT